MKTGRRGRVDAAYWTRLLELMRAQPGAIMWCAARMKSDHKTVKRLWERGEPAAPWGVRPMKDVIAAEQTVAAAARIQSTAIAASALASSAVVASPAQATAARSDAVLTRTEEARLLKSARANTQALLQVVSIVSQGALKLAESLKDTLRNKKKLEELSAQNAMLLLVRYQRLAAGAVLAADTVVELEHRVLGDPKERAGDETALEADDMSEEEAIEELLKASEIGDRMRAIGLRVVQGGPTPEGASVSGNSAGVTASAAAPDVGDTRPATAAPSGAGPSPARGLRMNITPGPVNGVPHSVNGDANETGDHHAQEDEEEGHDDE